jgi:hypothetical protein
VLPLLLVLLGLAAAPDDSVRELARRIAAALQPRETVALSVRNASSLDAPTVAAVRRGIESQLRAGGFMLASDAATSVAVILSENPRGGVWIAEIRRGDEREVAIVAPARPPEQAPKTQVEIEKQLLVEQADPVLDAIAEENALTVLESGEVVFYRRQDGRWVRRQALALPRRVWPRDLRGQLELQGDSLRILLPGVVCEGKGLPDPALDCRDSKTPLVKGRNYFEDDKLPPHYSAARVGEYSFVAALDGRTQVLDAAMAPVGAISGWGSDFAAVDTGCGSGRQVLVTHAGGAVASDAVQAFELVGRQPVAVSAPVEFSGPVTALWSAGQAEAIAVSRDPKTGRYAAFRITVTCSR